MSQVSENSLSDEDAQQIRNYRLGNPLRVYGLSPRYIRFERITALILSALCILQSIAWVIITGHPKWPSSQIIDGLIVLSFFAGVMIGLVAIPHVHKHWLIVCETGLLDVTKISWYRSVQVIDWKNIQAMRKQSFPRGEYRITYRRGRPLLISSFIYQNGDELLACIQERVAEAKIEQKVC